MWTDKMFGWLMLAQWLLAIALALIVSPRAWEGSESHIHIHVLAATLLGGLMTVVPVLMVWARPGWVATRWVVASAQMMMSGLLIHLTGGRIETHFHVFGSLAFLVFYRDAWVFLPATLVVAVDHLVRGLFFPLSVYGTLEPSLWRTLEHAAWVLFEDAFLVYACVQAHREMWRTARQQAILEEVNASIEQTVRDRTAEAEASKGRLMVIVKNLTAIVNNVQRAGIQITGVTADIGATTKQQQASVTEQAAVATEIMATSREISATSRGLVANMEHVARSADETAQLAGAGSQSLQQMQDSIRRMVESSQSIAAKLAVVSEKAGSIGGVITAISRVADQTNLLSLNAAIEAEKAGEHARGFSVVAGEIRRLADQTAVSALDIERIIGEMQSSVTGGVMAMDSFRREVSQSETSVRAVVEQLTQIIDQVCSMSAHFEQVTDGMKSQAAGAEQISTSIAQLSESAQQTATSVREFGGVLDRLGKASNQLQETVASCRELEPEAVSVG